MASSRNHQSVRGKRRFHPYCFLGLFFDTEHGRDTSLQNVGGSYFPDDLVLRNRPWESEVQRDGFVDS
jgi:hypothetical protein